MIMRCRNTTICFLRIIISLFIPIIVTLYREFGGHNLYSVIEYDYWLHDGGVFIFFPLWGGVLLMLRIFTQTRENSSSHK